MYLQPHFWFSPPNPSALQLTQLLILQIYNLSLIFLSSFFIPSPLLARPVLKHTPNPFTSLHLFYLHFNKTHCFFFSPLNYHSSLINVLWTHLIFASVSSFTVYRAHCSLKHAKLPHVKLFPRPGMLLTTDFLMTGSFMLFRYQFKCHILRDFTYHLIYIEVIVILYNIINLIINITCTTVSLLCVLITGRSIPWDKSFCLSWSPYIVRV